MYDHRMFVETTAEFAEKLLSQYDIGEVLGDLAARVVELLSLFGSGVTFGSDGRLRAVAAVPPVLASLEAYQEEHQDGPCVAAYQQGVAVAVEDLRSERRWPGFCRLAEDVGVRAVVGVPMRLGQRSVGALNMYSEDVRDWSEDDLDAARVLANMATGYLINASTFHKQTQLTEQLQHALDSRVVIEQAKGVVAEAQGISVDDAFDRIRRHARSHNATVRTIAEAVVEIGLRP